MKLRLKQIWDATEKVVSLEKTHLFTPSYAWNKNLNQECEIPKNNYNFPTSTN